MELNRIVKETEARVVMSSCWRIGRELIEIKELLHNWEFVGIVVGKTPYLRGDEIKRGDEIQWWLDDYKKRGNQYGEVEKFVIIDDDADMKHLLPYLVKCNFNTGLTTGKADLAIEKLI